MIKKLSCLFAAMGLVSLLLIANSVPAQKSLPESFAAEAHGLWSIYDKSLKNAKYIDLTHT